MLQSCGRVMPIWVSLTLHYLNIFCISIVRVVSLVDNCTSVSAANTCEHMWTTKQNLIAKMIGECEKLESCMLKLEFCSRETVCVGDIVNKRRVGRRHRYLYIDLPDGAFSVISFWKAVILWSQITEKKKSTASGDHSAHFVKVSVQSSLFPERRIERKLVLVTTVSAYHCLLHCVLSYSTHWSKL